MKFPPKTLRDRFAGKVIVVAWAEHASRNLTEQQLAGLSLSDLETSLMSELGWQPIETAPKDGTLFLAWAPGREGLPSMFSLCAWHPDAGFCIDELREATNWMPLPEPPEVIRG